MVDPFAVHDLQVQETPFSTPTGDIVRRTVVRYFVGDHGPFQDVYESTSFDPAVAQEGILKRVRDLRTLASGVGA